MAVIDNTSGLYRILMDTKDISDPDKHWYGIEGIHFVWNGAWNDAQIIYNGRLFSAEDIEGSFHSIFYEEHGRDPEDSEFEDFMLREADEVKAYIDELIWQDNENHEKYGEAYYYPKVSFECK